jgi:hypothetical protein
MSDDFNIKDPPSGNPSGRAVLMVIAGVVFVAAILHFHAAFGF